MGWFINHIVSIDHGSYETPTDDKSTVLLCLLKHILKKPEVFSQKFYSIDWFKATIYRRKPQCFYYISGFPANVQVGGSDPSNRRWGGAQPDGFGFSKSCHKLLWFFDAANLG